MSERDWEKFLSPGPWGGGAFSSYSLCCQLSLLPQTLVNPASASYSFSTHAPGKHQLKAPCPNCRFLRGWIWWPQLGKRNPGDNRRVDWQLGLWETRSLRVGAVMSTSGHFVLQRPAEWVIWPSVFQGDETFSEAPNCVFSSLDFLKIF